jgi:hypothetical protein
MFKKNISSTTVNASLVSLKKIGNSGKGRLDYLIDIK